MKSHTWIARPRNLTADGIHNDESARQLGFSGGFVAGVALYEHIVNKLIDEGENWYDGGSAEFSFRKPVYDNQPVTFSIDGSSQSFSIFSDDETKPHAVGSLRIDAEVPVSPVAQFETPEPQPLGFPSQIGVPLQVKIQADAARADWVAEVTGRPLQTIDGQRVYPLSLWLNPVDLILSYFESPYTIHYWGRVWHHSPVFVGEIITKSGLITEFGEDRTKKTVSFLAWVATENGRPVATIEHKSVYALHHR